MSQNANRAKLGRWLHPLMFAPGPEGRPARLELRHLGASDRATVVRAWTVRDADEDLVKMVCDQLDQAAADDADGVGGVQKYAALGLDAEAKPLSRLVLRYRAEALAEAGDGDSYDSEPANAKGLTSAAMRHAEVFAKAMSMSMAGTIEQLARQNMKLGDQNAKLMEQHAEFLAAMEELQSRKHERDLELTREAASAKQKEIVAEEVASLIPAVVQKFTGVTPARYLPPEVSSLRKLAGGLTDEQIAGIMAQLSPAQQASLATVLADAAQGEVNERESRDGEPQ